MTIPADAQIASFAHILFADSLPKSRAARTECEDRFAWNQDIGGPLRIAVADGASASLLAGEWAQMLVEAYCSGAYPDRSGFIDRAKAEGKAWRDMVQARDLPWYASAKRDQGAFAALVGVSIQDEGRWSALAVGDSCVFQVRRAAKGGSKDDSGCINAFPLDRIGQFGSTPDLLGTAITAAGMPNLETREYDWITGDDLYLMTDALAEWFLGEVGQHREPWRWFDAIESTNNGIPFEQFVDGLRESRKLKDDDVTLLHAKLADSAPSRDFVEAV